MDTKGERWWGGMNWETRIDIHTTETMYKMGN